MPGRPLKRGPWEASGKPLKGPWEAPERPLGGPWEAPGRVLGGPWEPETPKKFFGRPCRWEAP